jgi:hypothetical protein
MTLYELTNTQRKYFGLLPIMDSWDKQILSDVISVYFDKDKIVKIINYSYGYLEYDTDIDTINRTELAARSSKGKTQKLTIQKLLKIVGSGIQFSISFQGGGITVYDYKRKIFIIKSFFEDGQISNFNDATNWIEKFIQDCSTDYFNSLNEQLKQPKKIQHAKPGDIIAFQIGRSEYGFARILQGIRNHKETKFSGALTNLLLHPRSLTVAPYAFTSNTITIDINKLIEKETLPSIYIFDNEVFYSEMPIIGHKPLTEKDLVIPLPTKNSTSVTIFYTKTDILRFVNDNKLSNSLS